MPALTMAQYEEIEYQLDPSEQLHAKARTYLDVKELTGNRRILLKTREFIGFLPLTAQTYVIVRPKGKIEDLFHMIAVSGRSERRIPERIGADWNPAQYPDLLDFMAHDFSVGLHRIERYGFWKLYEECHYILPLVRGKISVNDTVRGPWMHGFSHMLACQVADPNINFAPNRVLRACTISLLRTYGLSKADRKNLYKWERIFRRIPLRDSRQDVREVAKLLYSKRQIPSSRMYYRDLLSIALFVLEHSSISLAIEGPVDLNAFAVNMDQVFEGYVRSVIADGLSAEGYSVKDGNQSERFLFENSNEYRIRPDILIEKAGRVVAVADAKYTKGKPSKDDMAQILSYMAAFGHSKGLLICPKTSTNLTKTVFQTPLYQVIVFPIDLSEMSKGEASIVAEARDLL